MTILTAEQVAGVVLTIGPPAGTTVAQWVAKARQESGFNTDAVSVTGCCVGLWQINVDAHMSKIGAVNRDDAVSQMKSPLRNWYVAKLVYAADGWRPWTASGGKPVPSSADLAAAQNPDSTLAKSGGGDPGEAKPGFGALDPIQALSNALGAIVDPILAAGKWLGDPGNWVRVAQVTAGIGLALIAATLFAKPVVTDVKKTVSPL